MKKGIIVLLITVLAAGMAFAGLTGDASVQFTFNLDEGKGYGFGEANPQGMKYSFDFTIDAATVDNAEHQTDIWAEIGAEAKASIVAKNAKAAGEVAAKIDTLKITKANIHINDFTIDILGPKSYFQYAGSFTKDDDGNPNFAYAYGKKGTKVNAGGVNVLYDGYTLAFAFNNKVVNGADVGEAANGEFKWFEVGATAEDTKGYIKVAGVMPTNGFELYVKDAATAAVDAAKTMVLYVGAQTKPYEIAEGASIQAAANFNLKRNGITEKNAIDLGAAVKAAYAADKFSASIAVDGLLAIAENESKTIKMDALANAKYDIVNGAVYFGTNNLGKEGAEYVLEAKVGADIPVAEEIVVSVAGEVDKLYLNKKADAFKDASYTASVGTTVGKLSADAEFGWNVALNEDENGDPCDPGMKIAASASYALEAATVKGSVSVNFLDKAFYAVRPAASIETSAIVENCTLSLGWSGASFESEDVAATKATKSNGKIVAGAKIAF